MSEFEREISELLAQYRKQRDEAAETRQRINAVTATVTSPRRAVKVTVSARGEVTEIDFPTSAFRRMTPKELGDLLESAIAEARAKALEEVDTMNFGRLPGGISASEMIMGRGDVTKLISAEPHTHELVSEYLAHGRPKAEGDLQG